MPIPFGRQPDLASLARRTLGWPDGDKRSIPSKYLEALSRLIVKHPYPPSFLVDLEDHGMTLHRFRGAHGHFDFLTFILGGVVTCMVCCRDIPVGHWIKPSVYEFRDLQLFEDHISSNAHKQMVSASAKTHASSSFSARQGEAGTTLYKPAISGSRSGLPSRLSRTASNARAPSLVGIQPPSSSDVEPASSDVEEPPSPSGGSVIELVSSDDAAPQTKGKVSNRSHSWTFPDGEVITIESSDEDNAGDITFSQKTVMAAPQASTSRGALAVSRSLSSYGTPRATPMKRTISQPPWIYRSPPRAQSVASSTRSTSASEAGPSRRKRPFQYPDGEIIYATEEETDGGSSTKKMRYDTESEGPMGTDGNGMSGEDSDEEMSDSNQQVLPHELFPRARSNTFMPSQVGLGAQAQAGPSFTDQLAAIARGALDAFNGAMQPHASGSNDPQPNLGYHAPPAMGGLPAPVARSLQRHTGDFNLNYDADSPTTWLDQGGPDHAAKLQQFFDDTMDDHEGSIPVRDAAKALKLKNVTDRLPGMQVPLMPHQLIGVAWMVKQELGKVQGGILAKTMQTIALIVMNQPEPDNPRQSTLIVAPAALLDQWRQEIVDRTDDDMFRIRIHHGKDKLKTAAEVKKYDIIITTFQTLTNEFPADDEELKKRMKQKKKRVKRDEDGFIISDSEDNKGRNKKTNGRGPLASTQWYRVVLDEAQNIRNRATRSSRMMALLDAEYRWALTGTPVTNSLADLYGLVRFLHFAPFNDWSEFNERIARLQKSNSKLAGQRAQALLKKCLLRRTKETKLEGKPLIILQPKEIEIEELEFSADERQIYGAVEARQQQKFNRFLRAGTVMKNYSAVLVMLLRLRQVCNHPQLIAYAAGELMMDGAHIVGADDGDGSGCGESANSKSKAMAKMVMGDAKFERAMRQFRDIEKEMYVAEITGGDVLENEATECGICLEPYTNDCCITVRPASCGSNFNLTLLRRAAGTYFLFDAPLQGDAAANDQFGPGTRPCPCCRNEINKAHIFAGSIFTLSDGEKDEIKRQVNKEHGRQYKTMYTDFDEEDDFVPIRKGKGKGRARIVDEDDEDDEEGNTEGKVEAELKKMGEGEGIVPGAKMLRMAELLEQWHREAPEDKIIAYSQYLVETRRDQDVALRWPDDENGTLKCGGFGLNLTEANRVICMDLAWNAATENQAIDRVHRMGQVKSVFVKRLVVKDTIEARILKLQAQKQSLSDAALGEGSGAKMPRMNVAQLKMIVSSRRSNRLERSISIVFIFILFSPFTLLSTQTALDYST
ncbi:hypothetical protein FRC10_010802, partial [Ceratobasidium sp. 414]